VAGCCEYGDVPAGSSAMELRICCTIQRVLGAGLAQAV
jgi:hypothetical protein